MLRNDDEDQLRQLLSQTYANHTYMDKEIQDLFGDRGEPLVVRHLASSESLSSSGVSEELFKEEEHVFEEEKEMKLQEAEREQSKQIVPSSRHIFDDIYRRINEKLKAESIESVRHDYPLFLLSQPSYEIKDHIKTISLSFSGSLLRKNILTMDVGYCDQEKVFKVAVGTDQGSVVIFEPNSSKPQHIIDCFSKVCTVTCVKWSKNMQFLAISNDERELNVYCFKQPITIQNSLTYRLLKNPVEHCRLDEKILQSMVTELAFISQVPFKMIVVDENDEIFKLQMKKHIISTRPKLSPFPIKFSKFLDVNLHRMLDSHRHQGVLMAVSGESFITFCQIQPAFEVAMVFDKEKHGSNIKKSGFPHVNFRSQPNSVLVIWDKYLQIMSIQVQDFTPFKHRFSITHKYLLPDSTILGGFLSNTFIYQINRVGIKIYSTTTLQHDLSNHFKSKEVFFQKLNFQSFCYGEKIQEFISNPDIEVSDLRFLKGLFKSTNRNLLYSTNKGLQMIYFNTLQQYISNQIQNNNWKTALEILKDCYLGKVHQLDEIHADLMQSKIKELASRYINFLETIIVDKRQGERGQHMELLWNQELIFVFNILITTDLQLYLLEEVMRKIDSLSHSYVNNIIPFILMNRITKLTHQSLELFLQRLPKQIVTRLLLTIQTVDNDPQLSHQVNNLLIKHDLLLEFVDLNQKFKDYYTPLAVLTGMYLRLEHDSGLDIFQSARKKKEIGRLIAYSVYETLGAINFNKYGKNHNKQLLQSVLSLLMDKIFLILVREQPVALFQNILEQLYSGSCLEALNQLDVLGNENDLMRAVIESIPYEEVSANKCEKKYWIAVFKLYSRRIIDLQVFPGLKYLTIDDQIDRQFIAKFVHKCQEQIVQELLTLPQLILTDFFENLLFSNHITLVITVGKILHRYITTLDAMLSDPSQRTPSIYDFISSFISQLPPADMKLLRQLLKKHIKFFIQANAKAACDIICKHYLPDLNIFIDDLNGHPEQQLKLVRSVLELYSYHDSLTDLKVRYLNLLAETHHHEAIFQQLQKQNYPLDQSLDICRKHHVLQALAYLLVKSGGQGNTEEAIKVYFKIVQHKIEKLVQQGHGSIHHFQSVIMNYVKKCIHICSQLDVMRHHHYDNQWFIILSELQHLKRSLLRNWIMGSEDCERLRSIINKQAYPQFVQALISELGHQSIVMYLHSMMGKFDLEALQIIIDEMMRSYYYEKRIFIIEEMLLIKAENYYRSTVYKEELRGFTTNSVCSVCGQKSEMLIHYGCGHENHPSCSQDVKQCILCSGLSDTIFKKRIDNVTGLRIDIYSHGVRDDLEAVERQIVREDRVRRMQQFQQLIFVDL